jgi:hypothetical protein
MKLKKLTDSAVKLEKNKNNHNLIHYHPNKNNYNTPIQGMMKHKLAILKEDVNKEYEKGMLDIKHSRKELGKLYLHEYM